MLLLPPITQVENLPEDTRFIGVSEERPHDLGGQWGIRTHLVSPLTGELQPQAILPMIGSPGRI